MRVVVIGAGLIGISTAYFLSGLGHRVTVIERREGPGLEASFANGGMVTPSQSDPWNTPGILFKLLAWLGREDSPVLLRPSALPSLFGWGLRFLRNSTEKRFRRNVAKNARLAFYSLEVLRELRRDSGLHYEGSQCGTIKLFRDPVSLQHAAGLCDLLGETGVRCEPLDTGGVIGREPALAPVREKIAGGMFFVDDESGDAHHYCRSLAAMAAARGVMFRYGTTVNGLRTEGPLVRAVAASCGDLESDRIVVATGSSSPAMLKPLGIDLPVRPVKGYSLTLDVEGWNDAPRVPVLDEQYHIGVTPLGKRLRVAGTAEFCGHDTRPNRARIENLSRLVADLYPQSKHFTAGRPAQEWAGLRPYACDGVPVLGRTPLENLYLNTGHGHLGWTMAAGSGKLVADLVSGKTPDLDPAPYQLDRF